MRDFPGFICFSSKTRRHSLRVLWLNIVFLLFQMLCSPVSSGQRRIKTHVLSGRRKGRPWRLCTSMANFPVSDVFTASDLLNYNAWMCSASSVWSSVCGRAEAYAGRAEITGATLTIHAVTQKDSGEYRCEVTASEDHVNLGEASVTLNVLGMMGNPCVCTYGHTSKAGNCSPHREAHQN